MAANPRSAYELLLQAMQQRSAQQPNSNFGASQMTTPGLDYASPQGGLLGLLQASQSKQNQQLAPGNGGFPSQPRDPNFRQLSRLAPSQGIVAPSIVPDGADGPGIAVDGLLPASGGAQYAMGHRQRMSDCVDQCLHLLSSPSGDLQSSEFRQCVGKCMGRL